MGSREEFGRYLRAIRDRRNISRLRLARVLGYTSEGTIHNVEFGRTPLPVEKIRPLAFALGIELNEFLAKLEECEPGVYLRYVTLKKQFEDEFMGNLRSNLFGGRTDQVKAGEAHHHRIPGLSSEFLNRFLYIMSTNADGAPLPIAPPQEQIDLDLPFPKIADNNILLWEVAGHA